MILTVGALVTGYLGFRLMGAWVVAAVAGVVLALTAVAYQGVLSTPAGMRDFIQILAMTGLTSLFLFYAVFSMGRSLGLRWRKRQ
jgi:hypothetical protein